MDHLVDKLKPHSESGMAYGGLLFLHDDLSVVDNGGTKQ